MTNDNTIDAMMPPTTAIASGWSICDPAPHPRASGIIPATVASAVIMMGRNRRSPLQAWRWRTCYRALASGLTWRPATASAPATWPHAIFEVKRAQQRAASPLLFALSERFR